MPPILTPRCRSCRPGRWALFAALALLAASVTGAQTAAVAPPAPPAGPTAAAAAPAPAPAPARTWWAVVRLGGVVVGSAREATSVAADGAATTVSEERLVFNRMGAVAEVSSAAVTEEDAAGALTRIRAELRLSKQATLLEARQRAGRLEIETRAGPDAPPHGQILALSGPVLGPEGLRRRCARELTAPGDELAAQVLVPELGGLVTVHRRLITSEEIVVDGASVAARRVAERLEDLPTTRTVWLGADGELLRSTESSGFGDLEMVRVGEAEALAALAGGNVPAELYQSTLERANVRLPAPRALDRLRLRLRLRDPQAFWPELAGPTQRLLASTAETREVEVRRPAPPAPDAVAVPVPAGDPDLAANAILTADDPEIRRLAATITGGEADPYRRALALTAWVHTNLRFDLGIVLAPASELARDRRGTCAGYAVLLTTLARAAGIPARFVLGYVYVQGVWGGHAWVEMRFGDRWLPFDAALFAPGPADAARLALARDPLAFGLGVDALAGLQLFGHLEVTVLEYELAGVSHQPPEQGPAWVVEGTTYRNAGLGLVWALPSAWRVAAADTVWPDPRVVTLAGTGSTRATLFEEETGDPAAVGEVARRHLADHGLAGGLPEAVRAAGRPAWSHHAPGRAGWAWIDGPTTFVLIVDGAGAAERRRLLAGLAWTRQALAPLARPAPSDRGAGSQAATAPR